MQTRPIALATATALLTLIGAAFMGVGALLLVLAMGRLPLLDSVNAAAAVALIALGAIAAGWLAWLAAGSLWRGRARGWVGSLIVGVVAVGGALTALSNAGAQTPVVIGVVLTVATLVLLLAPSTRRAAGIA